MGLIQTVFLIAHQELQEASDITVDYAGMHHANIVRDVVTGLQSDLHQEQVLTDNTAVIEEPVDHVANAL